MLTQFLNINELPTAVFAQKPHDSRSDKYAHIPTIDIVQHMSELGYGVVDAQAARVRKAHKFGFNTHIVKFQHMEAPIKHDGTVSQILLRNAHDGTRAVELFAGVFRFVCANGIVAYSKDFGQATLGHRGGNLWERIKAAVNHIQTTTTAADRLIDGWSKQYLSYSQRLDFAHAALALRYPIADKAPIVAGDLLEAKRPEDSRDNAWCVFNRVQEHLVRGGLQGNATGKPRSVRRIRGADSDLRFNAQLWGLAEKAFA
jgi:hypothetical protein